MNLYLGIDFGTSGARAVVIDEDGNIKTEANYRFDDEVQAGEADKRRSTLDVDWAACWQTALFALVRQIPQQLRREVKAIAIDGTSSTVLLCDAAGSPVDAPLLYNDARGGCDSIMSTLRAIAPPHHTVLSATSSLAKLLWMTHLPSVTEARYFLHQADWLAFLLHGRLGISDYHNALKLGYDVEQLSYPTWLSQEVMHLLPLVLVPGTTVGEVTKEIAARFELRHDCRVCAGTTDSIAAFLASGAHFPGEAVTSLGSTLVLNLLTDQVAWQDGQGQVELQVRGTIKQPVATGIATVNNAIISAQTLPEPLTDVTGTVQFNRDRIQVESIEGKFSRGNVVAKGVIPINTRLGPNDPDRANPLTVSLDQLLLNLKDLYRGGASGNVEVTGSAFNPVIGGEVLLSRGQVSLPSEETPTLAAVGTGSKETSDATTSSAANKQVNPNASSAAGGTVPEFNNLRLTLGDRIEITRPPVLNFQATGTLTINGNRSDLRPDGTIRLRSGGINLFTTQFVLEKDNENTAIFSADQRLDPNLDIELIARVPEVTQSRVPDSPLSAEINQPLSTDLGAIDTVRVQARVTGPASRLFDNLELTSDPSRTETEIVALLGGGFVNTLGRGDSTVGIANLAGSALLGNFQGTFSSIGNTLGLSELRLFPTVITSERARTSSTLGLAAEAGIDISGNVSASILRVLTADQPTQFGLSYRVNNQVRLRTSTDLSGDSRAVVEYENDF